MKKLLFYAVIVLQIIVVSVIGIQYYLIDDFGVTIKLTAKDPDFESYNLMEEQEVIYVNYDINSIGSKEWDDNNIPDHDTKIYVLLEAGENGIYHMVHASTDKMQAKTNQFVLAGKYRYNETMTGLSYVDYGIEEIRNTPERFEQFSSTNEWIITLKVAPWGQKKIVDVEAVRKLGFSPS